MRLLVAEDVNFIAIDNYQQCSHQNNLDKNYRRWPEKMTGGRRLVGSSIIFK